MMAFFWRSICGGSLLLIVPFFRIAPKMNRSLHNTYSHLFSAFVAAVNFSLHNTYSHLFSAFVAAVNFSLHNTYSHLWSAPTPKECLLGPPRCCWPAQGFGRPYRPLLCPQSWLPGHRDNKQTWWSWRQPCGVTTHMAMESMVLTIHRRPPYKYEFGNGPTNLVQFRFKHLAREEPA